MVVGVAIRFVPMDLLTVGYNSFVPIVELGEVGWPRYSLS